MAYNSKFGRRKKSRPMNTLPAKRRLFGGRKHRPCAYCGKTLSLDTATFDHVVPLSKGGYDKTKNGALACRKCNTRKGVKSAEEFLKKIAAAKAAAQ